MKPAISFLVIFFFFALSFVRAESEGDDNGFQADRISSIEIAGLKRTRLSTAERPLRKFIGREVSQLDLDEVRAAILATEILEPLSVEIDGLVLSVVVREKWAIFPIPVVMGGSGGTRGGLAFYDANAFGLNDKLFVAGFYHSDGWAASGGYIHASRGGRAPGWNTFASFSREERHDRDQNDEVLRRFDLDTISAFAGLNFPLLENSNLLTASVLFSYSEKNLKNLNTPSTGQRRIFACLGQAGSLQ